VTRALSPSSRRHRQEGSGRSGVLPRWCGTAPFVTAEVQLHRPIPVYDANRARGDWSAISGTIRTLPVGYLCPRHAELVMLPLRMGWPMDASDVTLEDVR
jgi:hypothetical protein